MDQLTTQLAAGDVHLSTEVLDRIDELVPPGTNLLLDDTGYQSPALTAPWRRRRNRQVSRRAAIGIETRARTETLEGVAEGDKVILDGPQPVPEGASIEIER